MLGDFGVSDRAIAYGTSLRWAHNYYGDFGIKSYLEQP